MSKSESKAIGNCPVPESTLRRMPIYLQYLQQLSPQDTDLISAATIAKDLDFNPVQVRKDLAMTEASGRPKTGYKRRELLVAIENFLGYNKTDEALLVGVGRLGQALLSYEGFVKCGFNIVVAFDNDPQKIGTAYGDTEIMSIAKLENLAPRLGVKIGIITVPGGAAQTVADCMVQAGIVGIWNFTSIKLQVPEHVVVQDENITTSFTVLAARVNGMLQHA